MIFKNHFIFLKIIDIFFLYVQISIFFRVFKIDLLTYNLLQVIQSRATYLKHSYVERLLLHFNISPRNRRILSFARKLTDHLIILFGSDSFLTKYDLQLIMYVSFYHPLLQFFGVELSFSNHIADILWLIPFQHNPNQPDI